MPNVFTRVPDRPVPRLPAWAAGVLRVADLFMVAMYSRPPTGTLATTWVTPGTLQLCAGVTVAGAVLGVFLLAAANSAGLKVLGAVVLLLALWAASVAVVGLLQRR